MHEVAESFTIHPPKESRREQAQSVFFPEKYPTTSPRRHVVSFLALRCFRFAGFVLLEGRDFHDREPSRQSTVQHLFERTAIPRGGYPELVKQVTAKVAAAEFAALDAVGNMRSLSCHVGLLMRFASFRCQSLAAVACDAVGR
jgi:hypothetical protein